MVAVPPAAPAESWVGGATASVGGHSPSDQSAGAVASEEQAPDPLQPGDPSRGERWAALHICSRREKRFARLCDHLRVRHYLPLYDHRTGAHRRRTYQLPLFPGYLFACLDHESRREILRTRGIVQTLWPERESVLLHELRQIRAALEASVNLIVGPTVSRGDLVRVICGPLEGVEGVIRRGLRRRGQDRLVLNVSMLGNCVAIEIDLQDVQRVQRVRRVKALDHHSLVEAEAC